MILGLPWPMFLGLVYACAVVATLLVILVMVVVEAWEYEEINRETDRVIHLITAQHRRARTERARARR